MKKYLFFPIITALLVLLFAACGGKEGVADDAGSVSAKAPEPVEQVTAGDIVLYNGSNIVMFYGSNSWSYTRIGKIDDLSNWTAALGSGDITAIFTLAE